LFDRFGGEVTADVVDKIKTIGFAAATVAGVSISINDVAVPAEKASMIAAAEKKVAEIDRQFQRGLITEQERYEATVKIWTDTTKDVIEAMMRTLDRRGSVYMMATSGARGNTQQMGQIGGMRGLIADPQGRIIDLPIRSNFREGLSVLEYFISTHGGRKGLADTAIRTADSGYLTRRLVDVAQDVIVRLEDCGDEDGIFVNAEEVGMIEPFPDRLFGRVAAMDVDDPKTNERIVSTGGDIDRDTAEIDGIAEIVRDPDGSRKIVVRNMQDYTVPISVPGGYVLNVEDGAHVAAGDALAKPERRTKGKIDMPAPVSGTVHVEGDGHISIAMQEVEERVYEVAHQARLRIDNGKQVSAGDFLT